MRFFLFDYNHQLNLFAPTTAVPFLQFGFGKNFFLHHCFYFNNDIFLHKEGKSIMLNKCNSKAVQHIGYRHVRNEFSSRWYATLSFAQYCRSLMNFTYFIIFSAVFEVENPGDFWRIFFLTIGPWITSLDLVNKSQLKWSIYDKGSVLRWCTLKLTHWITQLNI